MRWVREVWIAIAAAVIVGVTVGLLADYVSGAVQETKIQDLNRRVTALESMLSVQLSKLQQDMGQLKGQMDILIGDRRGRASN